MLTVSILTRHGSRVQRAPGLNSFPDNEVSILTRHGSRVQHSWQDRPDETAQVSILTRHGSRVQQKDTCELRNALEFQSSPGMEAGCDEAISTFVLEPYLFQSSPGMEAGCNTVSAICMKVSSQVSILTRHGSRVQRMSTPLRQGRTRRFNPHPAWKPGATWRDCRKPADRRCFNPHPAWKPGATYW